MGLTALLVVALAAHVAHATGSHARPMQLRPAEMLREVRPPASMVLLSEQETVRRSTQGAGASRPQFKGVTFNKRLLVNGTMECKELETANLTVLGDVSAKTIKSSRLSATLISADVLETSVIRSPTNTITIDGNLVLDGSNAGATSFLATEVIVGGVRQWRLLHHDDFDKDAAGWDTDARSTCGSNDWFLGGHCKLAAKNATKTFAALPHHSQMRIKARVHFLDHWQGEAAFMSVDGQLSWLDTATSPPKGKGLDMCGNPAFAESRFSIPLDVTLKHSAASVAITFGSSLGGSACEHSWGVDDVTVFVR